MRAEKEQPGHREPQYTSLGLLVRALALARWEMGSPQKAGAEERCTCLVVPLAVGREQAKQPTAGDRYTTFPDKRGQQVGPERQQ